MDTRDDVKSRVVASVLRSFVDFDTLYNLLRSQALKQESYSFVFIDSAGRLGWYRRFSFDIWIRYWDILFMSEVYVIRVASSFFVWYSKIIVQSRKRLAGGDTSVRHLMFVLGRCRVAFAEKGTSSNATM